MGKSRAQSPWERTGGQRPGCCPLCGPSFPTAKRTQSATLGTILRGQLSNHLLGQGSPFSPTWENSAPTLPIPSSGCSLRPPSAHVTRGSLQVLHCSSSLTTTQMVLLGPSPIGPCLLGATKTSLFPLSQGPRCRVPAEGSPRRQVRLVSYAVSNFRNRITLLSCLMFLL